MPRRRRTPHFDVDYLTSLGDGPGEVFVLSAAGVAVLSDLAQMLLWETRWYDELGPLGEVPALGYQLHEELKVPLHLDDLIPYVDEIEDLLRNLANSGCCDALPGLDSIVTELPNGVETSGTDLSTDTVPAGYTDAADFRANYLCDASVAWVDALIEWPDTVVGIVSATVNALLVAILTYTTGAYIGIAGAVAGLLDVPAILSLVGTVKDLLDQIAGENEDPGSTTALALDAVRDDLIAAVYCADTSDDAWAAVSAIVAAEVSTGWHNLFLLWPHKSALAKVFNDAADPPTSGYSCGCSGTLATGMSGIRFEYLGRDGAGAFSDTKYRQTGAGVPNNFMSGTVEWGNAFSRAINDTIALCNATGLALVTDTVESSSFTYGTGDRSEHRLLVRNEAGSAHSAGIELDLLQVFDGASWLNVVSVEIVSQGGSGTWSADGTLLTLANHSQASGAETYVVYRVYI